MASAFLLAHIDPRLVKPADALVLGRSGLLSAIQEPSGVPVSAETLAEAISSAETLLNCRITPHTPPKYFRLYSDAQGPEQYFLVDIHVKRNGSEMCPKQELGFPIQDGDLVTICTPIC